MNMLDGWKKESKLKKNKNNTGEHVVKTWSVKKGNMIDTCWLGQANLNDLSVY